MIQELAFRVARVWCCPAQPGSVRIDGAGPAGAWQLITGAGDQLQVPGAGIADLKRLFN